METLTLAQIKDFAIVFLAILAFIVLLGNVVKTVKEWVKPGMSEKEWRKEVDRKLDSDNKRIDDLSDGIRELCKSNLAILNHLINGNSKDKLTEARDNMNDYLIQR